ncbi:unnamed protein product [Ixodes pacificus]
MLYGSTYMRATCILPQQQLRGTFSPNNGTMRIVVTQLLTIKGHFGGAAHFCFVDFDFDFVSAQCLCTAFCLDIMIFVKGYLIVQDVQLGFRYNFSFSGVC